MIDTHTHLYDEAFDEDFTSVVSRATGAGVQKFILPGIDSSVAQRMIRCKELLGDKGEIAWGLHPTSVDSRWKEELSFVEKQLSAGENVAIGEIGLDCYWSKEYLAEQKEAFLIQMRWANELDLPVIIHIRDAHDHLFECMDTLSKENALPKGVFHAFSGSIETYHRIKKYGDYKVGIGGVVTYKKASISSVLEEIPIEDILLETDSPWLTPTPFRGKRNEPSYLIYIAEKIGEIKQLPVELIKERTTQNGKKLFNLI